MQLTVRQQEIIDAALALIAEQGIQNLTIKNIAAALKITEPAIYRHFDSKFAILDALLDSFDHGSVSVLADSAANQRSPLERIEAFVLDRYRRVKERPYLSKVMFSGELFLFDERLSGKMLAMMHRHKTRISALIEEGQAEKYVRAEKALRSVKGGRYAYLFRELADLCAVLETKVKLAVELKKAYAEKDKARLAALSADFKTLLSRIDKFYKSFAAAWAKENKPFGFEVQDIRIGGLIARVKAVAGKVAAFAAGKTASIPELDEKHLPYGCFGGETSFEDLFFNSWGHNVTASIL